MNNKHVYETPEAVVLTFSLEGNFCASEKLSPTFEAFEEEEEW